ncbi:MAG: hypothetical protein LBH41_01755 [Rickettsiales bacterium]|jgi:myo-inositol-1(or 4)-monophosphatase|nr:hypothetical protein [Rickettsiales bacterium]
MRDLTPDIAIMTNALQASGRFVLRDFGELEQLQSSADNGLRFAKTGLGKVEKTIVENLLDSRPKFGIMTPTQTIRGTDISHRFIVNPIDGFDRFARALPSFAMSIALQEQRNIVAAAVYSPVMDKLFTATKGGGAFVRDARLRRRLRVSRRVENPALAPSDMCPSLAMCSLASGSCDALKTKETSLFSAAAGSLFVREAGGVLRALDAEWQEVPTDFGVAMLIAENNCLQPALIDSIITKRKEKNE